MDENLENNHDEFADRIDNTAQEADEHNQAAQSAWQSVEDPVEPVRDFDGEEAWEPIEEPTEEVIDAVQAGVENAWNPVGDETVQTPPAGQKPHHHTYHDEYVIDESDECCDPQTKPDPIAASEFGSSPIGLGPDIIGPTLTPEDVRSIRADHIAKTQKRADASARTKKEFSIWAIILIILLGLCVLVILPVLLVIGGGWAIFQDLFASLGSTLPYWLA